MVDAPDPTPVTWKFALADPGDTIATAPTDATDGEEDASEIPVDADTTDDIPIEKTCAFPGASVTDDGESDCKTGVDVPPDPGTLT
jgi:hypothetical protein